MKIFGINITRDKRENLADKQEPEITGKKKKRLSQKVLKERRLDIDVEMTEFLQAVSIAKDSERPDRKQLYAIYEKITERDSHLKSQLRTAHFTVQQSEFQIILNETENKELKKLFETGWFTDFITYAIDQEFWGHSLVEFGYLYDKRFKDTTLIDRFHVIPEFQSVILETFDDITDGISYAENLKNWFLVEIGKKRDLGLLLTATIDIIYKNDARTDWASFNERFGMPLLAIKTDTSNETELDELENMAINFGSNGYVIGGADTEFEVKQASGTENGHDKFQSKVVMCDDYISKLINGQTGTSDNHAYVGTAEVQERVLNTYTKGRLQRIQRVINDKLIPFLIYHGYPLEGAKFQYVDLLKKEVKDTVTDTDTEKKKSKLKSNNDLTDFYTLVNSDIIEELAFKDKLKPYFDKLTERIHKLASKNKLPKEQELLQIEEAQKLLTETAKIYEDAISKGFKLSKTIPDAEFVEKLTKSAWVFSGFKTNRQLKDISAKLYLDDKIKPFNKFRDEVLSIHKNYNVTWLNTEYNQAISSSLQANNWKLYEKNADKYYLQYRTAGDERVRGSHKRLNGITLPMSHEFWNEHFAPNGWGCRCGQKQVLKSQYKQTDEADVKAKTENFFNEKEKIFAYNSGKTGALFPEKHPYYNVLKRYDSIKQASLIVRNKAIYESFGDDYIKEAFDENTGGFWVSHKLHNFDKNTGIYEKKTAKYLIKQGHSIELLSENADMGIKSLDAKINNSLIYEIKTNLKNSHRALKGSFESAKKQKAKRIIIYIASDMKYSDILSSIERIKPKRYGIKELWIIHNDKDWIIHY